MGMGWVCRHRRHGAVLALIALALQIVVAFGHVHLHGLAQNPHDKRHNAPRLLTPNRMRRRKFRPTMTIIARFVRRFFWRRVRLRRRRRNCSSLRISSESSIP